jgi:hypothetical protein
MLTEIFQDKKKKKKKKKKISTGCEEPTFPLWRSGSPL